MKKKAYQLYIYGAGACLLIAIGLVFLYCFSSFSTTSLSRLFIPLPSIPVMPSISAPVAMPSIRVKALSRLGVI